MAKKAFVKITGVDQARKNLLKFVNDQIKDNSLLNDAGKEAVDQIRKRTQAGQEEYKQKPLTDVTIETRKLLSVANGEGGYFKAERSNVTLSGQLLESISFSINSATSEVKIFLRDFRYKILPLSKLEKTVIKSQKISGKKGQTQAQKSSEAAARAIALNIAAKPQETKTNNQIRKDLEERDRKFLFISEKLNALLQSKITQALRKRLSIYSKIIRK